MEASREKIMNTSLNLKITTIFPMNINPKSMGGGEERPWDAKFSEMCPCSHNNNTALIKQISLFDTALVMIKNLKFQSPPPQLRLRSILPYYD